MKKEIYQMPPSSFLTFSKRWPKRKRKKKKIIHIHVWLEAKTRMQSCIFSFTVICSHFWMSNVKKRRGKILALKKRGLFLFNKVQELGSVIHISGKLGNICWNLEIWPWVYQGDGPPVMYSRTIPFYHITVFFRV